MKKKILSLLVAFIAAGSLTACGTNNPGTPGDSNKCGNNTLDTGEKCDNKIAAGQTGACPTAESCTAQGKKLSGTAAACSAECVVDPNAATCGDGNVTAPETCDKSATDPAKKCLTKALCEAQATTDGDHKWVFSGKVSDCTAKCEEVQVECDNTKKDGFCPASCTTATDSDCHNYWDECATDDDCPANAHYCASFKSLLNIAGVSQVKRCTAECDAANAVCGPLKFPGQTSASVCTVDFVKSNFQTRDLKGKCSPGCATDTDCPGDDFTCNNIAKPGDPQVLVCLYNPVVKAKQTQLGKPCNPSDESTCEGGMCIPEYYAKTGADSGFCTSFCAGSTPEGLSCSREGNPTSPHCELFSPLTAKKSYFCFAGCTVDTDCVSGKEFCAKVAGEASGTCRKLPVTECKDKKECEDAGDPTTVGYDCVDNIFAADPSTKFCVAPGTGAVKIGDPLAANQTVADCKAPANKAILFDNTCSVSCAGPLAEPCPTGTACAFFNSEVGYCLKDCEADAMVCAADKKKCTHAVGGVQVCL